MKLIFVLVSLLIILGCNDEKKPVIAENCPTSKFNDLCKLEVIQNVFWYGMNGNDSSNYHHLEIKNYCIDCLTFYDFVNFSKKYYDTVTVHKPATNLIFMERINNTGDNQKDFKSIIGINFNLRVSKSILESVTIYRDGSYFNINGEDFGK